MGVVYRAYDPKIGRPVALKTLSSEVMSAPDALTRFYREAQSAGKLDHPNIVTIFELGDDRGVPYIAMELLEGKDLSSIIKGKEELSIPAKIDILAQVCRGLDYAHRRGIIHRDIKPANIILRKDGVAKIVDFGIARIVSHEMTQSGMLLGTVSYMSPEQVEGMDIDGRSDVFSAGCLLYELLTHNKAFAGNSITEVIAKILHQNPAPIRRYEHLAGTSIDELERILARALAKDRNQRYQTAEEMAQGLQSLQRALTEHRDFETALSQPSTSVGKSVKGNVLRAVGALAFILLVAGGAYLYLIKSRAAPASRLSGSVSDRAATSRNGSLAFNILPWGEIKQIVNTKTGELVPLDGKLYTPLQISLPQGAYRVTVINPYFAQESLILDVDVVEDALRVVRASFPAYDVSTYLREN